MYTSSIASALVAGLALPLLASGQQANQSAEPMLLLSQDEDMHFEFTVGVGEVIYHGGDIGPLLGVAKDLLPYPGDFETWSDKWYNLAMDTKAQAMDPMLSANPVNVRDTWFSVANYFRRADFFNHWNWSDPRIMEFYEEQRAAFDKANALLHVPGQRINITADNFTVEAIWWAPHREDGKNCTKRPTLVAGTGYDGAQEDLYHTIVLPGLQQGWNIITYEGPGQPSVRRYQNLGFIPQWERVITPIVDWVLANKAEYVDEKKLALFGYSFGGELTARAAAFEHRFAAVILDPAIWNFFDVATASFSPQSLAALNSTATQPQFDAQINAVRLNPSTPTSERWGIDQGLWSFNFQSPWDWYNAAKQYTLDGIIDQIQGPVLVLDGQYETVFTGQPKKVADALGSKATYHLFNGMAGYHCQTGALQELNRYMYAWLHQTLKL